MPLQAEVEGPEPARGEEGIVGADAWPRSKVVVWTRLNHCSLAAMTTEQQVGMAGDIFGAGHDADVDAGGIAGKTRASPMCCRSRW